MTLNFIMNKYRILGKKGEGTFSEVLKCQNVKDGTYWACKKMKHHYESIDQVNNLREIQAMRRLSPHPNVLELQEVLFDRKSGTLVLICELMDMNIYELIRAKRDFLPEWKVRLYMYQLLRAVFHMHRNGIFHRDVKPENILIKDDLLKLADYGSCRSVHSRQPYTEYISTRWYRAPECLLTDGYYTYKMDIWSVGCVFFEIMSLHPLFPGSNEVDQIAKIHDVMGTPDANILSKLRNKTRGMNFNFPPKKGNGIEKTLPHVSSECVELIYQMCTYDPDERISAKQALRHRYFKALREAEKAALAKAQVKKAQAQQQQQHQEEDRPDSKVDSSETGADNSISSPKPSSQAKPIKLEVPQPYKKSSVSIYAPSPKYRSPVPESSGIQSSPAALPESRLPGGANITTKESILTLQRKNRKKRRRMAESGPANAAHHSNTFFPKVNSKVSSFQPTFNLSTYSHASTLPKIGTSKTSSTTYLPSLSQALVQSQRPLKVTQNPMEATKNSFGHYQLPSIERRGAGH